MTGAVLVIGAVGASSTASALEPTSLARAQAIRVQLDKRYRALDITEATSTGVIESFALLTPDLLERRVVPADNGIWYSICPRRAECPYPARRFARPASDFAPRRLALELAVRTFLETSVDVVGVALPTTRFTAFVVERTELAHEIDIATLAQALAGDPGRALVDRVTRPRVFLAMGLEPTPSGGYSWAGLPRWPTFTG